jgi:hypothetical protein
MITTSPNPPLSPPLCWANLPLSIRRRLLDLLGTMVLEALRASPRPVEVDDDERQHR